MMAAVPTVEAGAPTFDQGDTADNPNPAPSARRIREKAAVTKDPPITAPQDTPDEWASPPGQERSNSTRSADVARAIEEFLRELESTSAAIRSTGFARHGRRRFYCSQLRLQTFPARLP